MKLIERTWILTSEPHFEDHQLDVIDRCEWGAIYDVGNGRRRCVIETTDSGGVPVVQSIGKDCPDSGAWQAGDTEWGIEYVSHTWAASTVNTWKRRARLAREALTEQDRANLREYGQEHLLREPERARA